MGINRARRSLLGGRGSLGANIPPGPSNVVWDVNFGQSAAGALVTKTDVDGYNSCSYGSIPLSSGGGSFYITTGAPTGSDIFMGLSAAKTLATPDSYVGLDYALHIYPNIFNLYKSGVLVNHQTPITKGAGDVMKFTSDGTTIKVYQDAVLVYTFAASAAGLVLYPAVLAYKSGFQVTDTAIIYPT